MEVLAAATLKHRKQPAGPSSLKQQSTHPAETGGSRSPVGVVGANRTAAQAAWPPPPKKNQGVLSAHQSLKLDELAQKGILKKQPSRHGSGMSQSRSSSAAVRSTATRPERVTGKGTAPTQPQVNSSWRSPREEIISGRLSGDKVEKLQTSNRGSPGADHMRQAIQQRKGSISQPELPLVAPPKRPIPVSATDAEPASSRDAEPASSRDAAPTSSRNAANGKELNVSKARNSQTQPSKAELWHRVCSWAIPPLSRSTGTPSVQQHHANGAPVDKSQSAQLASRLVADLLELGRIPEKCHTLWDEQCSDLQPMPNSLNARGQANITSQPDCDGEKDPLIMRVELKVAAKKLGMYQERLESTECEVKRTRGKLAAARAVAYRQQHRLSKHMKAQVKRLQQLQAEERAALESQMAARVDSVQEDLLVQHDAEQLKLKQKMRHECAKMDETVTDLEARLKAATSECQDLSGKLAAQLANATELAESKQQLEDSLKHSEAQGTQLVEELTAQKEHLYAQLTAQNEQLRAQLAAKQAELEQAQEESAAKLNGSLKTHRAGLARAETASAAALSEADEKHRAQLSSLGEEHASSWQHARAEFEREKQRAKADFERRKHHDDADCERRLQAALACREQALQSEQAAGKAREQAMLECLQDENAAQHARLEQDFCEERAAMLAELASAREAFERAVQQERQKAGQATAECGLANKRAQILQAKSDEEGRKAAEAAEYKAQFSGLRAEVAETAQAHESEVKRLKAQKDRAHKRLEEAESDVRKLKADTSKQLQDIDRKHTNAMHRVREQLTQAKAGQAASQNEATASREQLQAVQSVLHGSEQKMKAASAEIQALRVALEAVKCSLHEREARSTAEPEVNAMQSELREAEAALEEIAACVRDAQPETPDADCVTDKRQPAAVPPSAFGIAEDARRVLATLKRERERLTAEAASLLDELMQAREQRALLEGDRHRSILDQQGQIHELQQALSQARQEASLLLTQAEQPSREAEDAAERVRAVQRRLADARRDGKRSDLRADWLEHQLSEAVARADAAENCVAHLQDRTRSLEGALVRAEEVHAATVTAWQERCQRRSNVARAEAEAKAGLWQCLQAMAEQLVQLPALPEAAESSGSAALDCAHWGHWRRVLQSLLTQNRLPPSQHLERLRAALLEGLDCAAPGLEERMGDSCKHAVAAEPVQQLPRAAEKRAQDLEEAEECADAASAESRATAVALNQRLAEAVAARRAAEASAAASHATAEALQHRVRALELAAQAKLEEVTPKATDVSSHERRAVELESRLHELSTQLDTRAAGCRQLEEVLAERTAELAQVRDDAEAMEQQQAQTHAELDQCRLLTRQLETRVDVVAADCRNLELSAQESREAGLRAEQDAAEQAQKHEAVSSQLKQALAEAASSHAAEVVRLKTRVSDARSAQERAEEQVRSLQTALDSVIAEIGDFRKGPLARSATQQAP